MIDRTLAPTIDISVVVPSHNSAPWLPTTLEALKESLRVAEIRAVVILVDDGSVDETEDAITPFLNSSSMKLRYVKQDNQGRFLARLKGLMLAENDIVLLLDSRVVIDPDSLNHIKPRLLEIAEGAVAVNGHVRLPSDVPLLGRFWEVPTHLFWSDYLRAPRDYMLNDTNFDKAPKGFGFFMAAKLTLLKAFRSVGVSKNHEYISDDTRVLRRLVLESQILLSPSFSAVYRPRVTLSAFVKHAFDRGTMFVDSYAGTGSFRTLIILLGVLAPIGFVILIAAGLMSSASRLFLFGSILFLLLLPALISITSLAFRAGRKSALSFFLYFYPFTVSFWLGLARGLLVHRGVWTGKASTGVT